ncbi:MAG: putative DNA-binding domain-containing protein [Blastocatellia bacterium]|nr:putative DNA-binding domain-containing protein [Blastocatellia bacterium]
MKNSKPTFQLSKMQQWIQTVITHPQGILAGVMSQNAQEILSISFNQLEDVVVASNLLSSAERFAIYYRSYYTRLLQAFHTMFPSLSHALGKELFEKFVIDYLTCHPPKHYSIGRIADSFSQHLIDTRPDAKCEEKEHWPDFIIELAVLEKAFLDIYDGNGLEDQARLDIRELLVLPAKRLKKIRPIPAPCFRLFAFRYPVHSYLQAVRSEEQPSIPQPKDSFVALTRCNYQVLTFELSSQEYILLQKLNGANRLEDLLDSKKPDRELTRIRDLLCGWIVKGFFVEYI